MGIEQGLPFILPESETGLFPIKLEEGIEQGDVSFLGHCQMYQIIVEDEHLFDIYSTVQC